MDKAQLIALAARDLPPFPSVAREVMDLVSDPDSGARDLQKVVQKDPGLTARVLRISNSALYMLRTEVTNLSQAIVILGMKSLESIVVAASSQALFSTTSFKDKLLWEHSLGVALVARMIAKQLRHAEAETAFTAGLLHDIGKPILDKNLGQVYQRVMQDVYNDKVTFIESEDRVLGFNHTDIGSLVVRKWKFSPLLLEAVHLHHRPSLAEVDVRLCAIVSLSNSMCVKMGLGPERIPGLALADLEAANLLGFDEPTMDECYEEIGRKISEASQRQAS